MNDGHQMMWWKKTNRRMLARSRVGRGLWCYDFYLASDDLDGLARGRVENTVYNLDVRSVHTKHLLMRDGVLVDETPLP